MPSEVSKGTVYLSVV